MCLPHAVRSESINIPTRNIQPRDKLLAGEEERDEIEKQQNAISSFDRLAKYLRPDQIEHLSRSENDPAIVQEHKRLFTEGDQ